MEQQQNKLAQGFQNVKRAKEELKKHRTMILDACLQDKDYQTGYLQIQDTRKVLKARKMEILDPSMIEKEKSLSEQLRLEKLSLSEWMREYVVETKMTTVSIQDSLFDIVPSYQLKPKHG